MFVYNVHVYIQCGLFISFQMLICSQLHTFMHTYIKWQSTFKKFSSCYYYHLIHPALFVLYWSSPFLITTCNPGLNSVIILSPCNPETLCSSLLSWNNKKGLLRGEQDCLKAADATPYTRHMSSRYDLATCQIKFRLFPTLLLWVLLWVQADLNFWSFFFSPPTVGIIGLCS